MRSGSRGLLSVDLSDNALTDTGLQPLLEALQEDRWLLAVYLHHNLHTLQTVAAFFRLLQQNASLLHFSLLPFTACPAAPPTAELLAAVSAMVDPHSAQRLAGLSAHRQRRLLMCPELCISDRSTDRFSHGIRAQRPPTPGADSARTLSVTESQWTAPVDSASFSCSHSSSALLKLSRRQR